MSKNKVALITGIISAFQLNFISKIISLCIVLPLMVLYTPIFKGMPLIGNIIISTLVGLVFIFAEVSIYGLIDKSLLPFCFSFLLTLIREIIKDIEDIKGDSNNRINTFPAVYGKTKSIVISIFLMFLLNIIVLIPYYFNMHNLNYLFVIIIGVIFPNSYCIIYLSKKNKTKNYNYIQKLQKLITIFGLVIIFIMGN